ncbi:MAG: PAS domain S-box protein, partial [bacterium]
KKEPMMLDIKTLMFLYLIANIVSAGAVAIIWSQNRGRFAGISFWLIDMILQAVGSALIVLRGTVPNVVSMTLSNTLILAGALFIFMGLERFTGKKGRQIHNYALLVVFIAVNAYFVLVQPNLTVREIAVSAVLAIYTFQCCWLLLRRTDPGMRQITHLAGIVFAAYAAFSLARIILLIVFPAQTSDFFKSGAVDALAITAYIVLSVCIIISLVLMVNRRLVADVSAQEEKFTKAFHSSPYAITLTKPSDGTIFEVNEGFVSITGYKYAEAIGKTTLGLNLWVREEDRLAVTKELARGRKIQGEEYEFRKKTGEVLTGLFSASLVTINNETCILANIGDITARKQVEEALRETRDYLEKLLRYANAPIIVWDPDFLIMRFNTAFERLTGYAVEEVIGKRLSLLFPLASRAESLLQIEHSHGGESWETVEIPIQCKDGSIRFVLWNSANIYTEDGTTLQATIAQGVDITERKQLEERIRQVRTDLLFAVSHDLKSPLQALHQSQEMLSALQPGEGLARFQAYSEIWRRNLQRLERMIHNLLDSQRSEEGRFPLLLAPCNPAEMIKRVVEDSQGYALSYQVSFDLNLQPVPEGACDEEALSRVVENLLTNAVKFSPKGGQVEVRLKLEDQTLLLEVEDHGLGIPAQEQQQLFQPFQRGRSVEQKRIPGTGLGLYVCRRIVEEHGGSISLTSEEGKGTVVTVRLPWGDGELGTDFKSVPISPRTILGRKRP